MGIEEKAVDLLEKLENITTTLAPQVLEVAEKTMVVSGIQGLVIGVLWGVVTLAFIVEAVYIGKKEDACYKKLIADKDCHWRPERTFFWVIPSLCAALCLIPTALQLGDVWNWVAILQPKLAIANKLLRF